MLENENAVRQEYVSRLSRQTEKQNIVDRKRSRKLAARLSELERLTSSVYEDKVTGKIPEEVCISLLEKYQAEKISVKSELAELERKAADTRREQADVDECPGKYSKAPREIHIYYKLIDKQDSQQQKLSWQNLNV